MEFRNIYQGLISGKEKLAVVGLGYVGIPIAVEFAKYVHVIGFDVNEKRIKAYEKGIDVTQEVGETEIKKTTVEFTADPKRLSEAKFIIVAVPTPAKEDASPDLSYLIDASKIIGENLTKGTIVVFESTVYPGATESVCVPVIEETSGLRCGVDWKVGYSPERINPGDGAHTMASICKIVSGMDEESAEVIKKVYEIAVKAGIFMASNIKTAEAVKLIENSQRDVNIAFMNEMVMICKALDIDTAEVMAGMDTKWNALGFRPGLVGGHCIGVDPYYLIDVASRLGHDCKIVRAGRAVNNSMSTFVVDAAVQKMREVGMTLSTATVVILGFTFKENCSDIRNSKIVDVIKGLKTHGVEPIVSDPWADEETAREEYGVELTPFHRIPKADCIILAVGHEQFRAISVNELKGMFKSELPDRKKVLLDIKSLYRVDELLASGMSFWRL